MKKAELAWAVFIAAGLGCAQTPATLEEAVDSALRTYPSLTASREQAKAAAAGVPLARTAFMPRVDVLAQLNRATRNNILGLLLPQGVLPSISGPVLGTNNLRNVWGSAAGFLASWEPFDFGLREANVRVAEAGQVRALAGVERLHLEIAAQTADAYLTLAAAGQTLAGARAQAERSRSILTSVSALVEAELRPGADQSRARADAAAADALIIRAEQAVRIARSALHRLTGKDLEPSGSRLLEVPTATAASPAASVHPEAKEQASAVAESAARLEALRKAYVPRFQLQASSYARGSGADVDGSTGGVLSGIGPNIQNWAVGFTVTFPLFELPSLRARQQIETHRRAAEQARYDQVLRDLEARTEQARAEVEGATRLAAQTPVQLAAAQDAERQATARYNAGLGTLVEVAQAQQLLTGAEIDDKLARLNIWRARLSLAVAQGDIQPVLEGLR